MNITTPHSIGQSSAKSKIDSFLDQLVRRTPPGGVSIQNPSKQWVGNKMNFSFSAKKGFFCPSIRISGSIAVNPSNVIFQSAIPGIVTSFVPESSIRDWIASQLLFILG